MLMIEQIAEVLLDLILQDQRGRDLTGPVTGRTNFLGIDRHLRLHPLTRGSGNARLHAAVRNYPAGLPRGQMAHTFNPWHQPVQMDAVTQLLLPHIDGSHNEADLLGILSKAVKEGALTVSHPAGESGEAGEHIVLARELERALKLLCA